jgi:nucleoside-diphosphate-sugar epimerase
MRVFVTGATGFVGSAVVKELLGAGHKVLGVSRSDAGAEALAATGAEVWRGSLEDPKGLAEGARDCDGVAHLAFNHDFSKFAENGQADKAAIEALGAVLEGSGRPLIVTSGVALLTPGKVSTEADNPAESDHIPRVSEQTGDKLAACGLRAMAIRLPPITHDVGTGGFLPILMGIAQEKGVSAYIDEGRNRWPAGHRNDAAQLYRLALETGAAGAHYHAIAEEGLAMRDIATAIGKRLGLPVASIAAEEAPAHYGWFTMFAGVDCPSSSQWTRETLGWTPTHAGLLADIAAEA